MEEEFFVSFILFQFEEGISRLVMLEERRRRRSLCTVET
jgi:hypothetical protein